MAKANGKSRMDFLVSYVKAHPKAPYAEVRDAAAKAGHKVFPIMFGRAQSLLGMIKGGRAKAPAAPKKTGARRGRPPRNAAPAAPAASAPKRRGRPPKSASAPAARSGVPSGIPLPIASGAEQSTWQSLVEAWNAGSRYAMQYDGRSWILVNV